MANERKDKNLFIPVTDKFHRMVKEHCGARGLKIQDYVLRLVTKDIFRATRRDRSNEQII